MSQLDTGLYTKADHGFGTKTVAEATKEVSTKLPNEAFLSNGKTGQSAFYVDSSKHVGIPTDKDLPEQLSKKLQGVKRALNRQLAPAFR